MIRLAALGLALAAAGSAGAQAPAKPPIAAADAAFALLDADRDGTVSRAEYRAGHARLQQAIAAELRLLDQFRALDTDRSGALEAREYASLALVKRAGLAAPSLSTFDRDADAKLGFGEYLVAVRALAATPAATR
jgi:hypothetical protein